MEGFYKHTKTGIIYKTLEIVQMKCPTTGNWISGVLYFGTSNIFYVRSFEDFNNKFEKVDLP